jgi:hypothetical protein
MATKAVIQFPTQTECPTCGRSCSEEQLSGCMTCGAKYCKYDDWTCDCDRMAAEIVERGAPEGALSRFLSTCLTSVRR